VNGQELSVVAVNGQQLSVASQLRLKATSPAAHYYIINNLYPYILYIKIYFSIQINCENDHRTEQTIINELITHTKISIGVPKFLILKF